MASPFQQRSLRRKFIYFGLIVALFTGSLLFRKLVVNAQAAELRLRHEDQGEVGLTDTALHLTLGESFSYETPEAFTARLRRNGFNPLRTERIDAGYLHPHMLYVAKAESGHPARSDRASRPITP